MQRANINVLLKNRSSRGNEALTDSGTCGLQSSLSLVTSAATAFLKVMCLVTGLCFAATSWAADTFNWDTNRNRVSADIQFRKLDRLLEQIAEKTSWEIFVEPGTTHDVSTKFKNLRPNEALRLLLGDLNFALVPSTNRNSTLFVFRTSRQNATQSVRAAKPKSERGKIIPNELIVRLKPGANIDEVARLLGAKVIGRIAGLNAYRLQFDSADAASAAREKLANNPDVASVDNNYSIDRPLMPRGVDGVPLAPLHLQLNPPPNDGRVIIGLIDTAVQSLGPDLDKFFLKGLSVAGDAQLSPGTPTHATSMAETLFRSLDGITKGSTSVQILPVDVYGPNASTTTFDVANGITLAINNGATVLNLSLGSEGDSPFLRDLLKEAIDKKIMVFAAAGNQPVTTPFYPAAYSDEGVIAVTAINNGQLAPYANKGSFINAAAPDTVVFYYNGQQWVAVGTSTSTAVASGAAAGYMDKTHSSVEKTKSFILTTFGVQKSAAGK